MRRVSTWLLMVPLFCMLSSSFADDHKASKTKTQPSATVCTRDSGSRVGGENYADLVRGGLVVAGVAAVDAVQEAVLANPHLHPRLAEAAILLAPTLAFWLLTLGAAVLGGAGSGGHEANVAR